MGYNDMDIESGGDFLKFVAGEPVTFRILSREPEKTIVHWVNKKKETCLGKECERCAEGNKKKQRWIASVWDRKSLSVKKIEFGSQIASQFKAIAEMMNENQSDIHETDIRIKTTGSSLETEYSVLHVPAPANTVIPKDVLDQYALPF